jgi:hypothetical protein
MKAPSMTAMLTLACLLGMPAYAQAQTDPTPGWMTGSFEERVAYITDLSRAKNLARQAAERVNGGLNEYWAEPSMHGPAAESPHVNNGDGTWTFTFRGGTPGTNVWDVESEVVVNRTTWEVAVVYNGPVR